MNLFPPPLQESKRNPPEMGMCVALLIIRCVAKIGVKEVGWQAAEKWWWWWNVRRIAENLDIWIDIWVDFVKYRCVPLTGVIKQWSGSFKQCRICAVLFFHTPSCASERFPKINSSPLKMIGTGRLGASSTYFQGRNGSFGDGKYHP